MILPGTALLAALAYLRLTTAPPGALRSVVKTLSTAALALAVAQAGGPSWLVAALGLSALGDMALSRPGDRVFLLGMAAFALAHGAYVLGFVRLGASPGQLLQPAPLAAALGLIALAALVTPRFVRGAGALAPAVAGYIAVILAMGLTALAVPGQPLLQAAAALFIASDVILGEQRFGTPRGAAADRALWAAYWSAQALFALSVLP